MFLVLFVPAVISFPGHKALVTNIVDIISIATVPLLLKFAVKDQRKTKQMSKSTEISQQKSFIICENRLPKILLKKQNNLSETVTIVNQSTVKYNKTSEPRNKEDNECHEGHKENPDEIIVERVDKIILEDNNIQLK